MFEGIHIPPMGVGNFKGLSALKYSAILCLELCNQKHHIKDTIPIPNDIANQSTIMRATLNAKSSSDWNPPSEYQ